MKQIIRNKTFETNSSSMHSISIMGYGDLTKLSELNYNIEFGEFGWEHNEHNDTYTILTYLWTLVNDVGVKRGKQYKELMKEWCPNCNFTEAEEKDYSGELYYDCPGWIDHGGCYDLDEIFSDITRFADIVLTGIIRTTNDNSEYEENWLEPTGARYTIYKGN